MKLFIPILIFISTLNALEITDSKEFYTSYPPTHLQTSFSIKLLNKDINMVQNTLSSEHKKITKVNNLCKGGAYEIAPRYIYKKDIKEFEGYEGISEYKCSFKNIDQFNKVINKLNKNSLIITLNPIQWKISKKVRDEQQDLLKIKALKYSEDFARSLKRSCKVKKINFNEIDTYPPQRGQVRYKAMKMEMDSFKPTKEDIQIKLRAGFKYKCE